MDWKYVKGYAYIFLFIIAYLGTAFLIKITFDDKEEEEGASYNKPLFIGYTACSSFIVYSVFLIFKFVIKSKCSWRNFEDKEIVKVELRTALRCYPVFFTTITLYYFCLSRTTVSTTIILGNTSSMFVFVFSLCILREKFSFIKMLAMMICIAGVIMIAYRDKKDSEGEETIIGDIFGVASAMLLGLYCVILSKMIPPHLETSISFFNILAFLGTLCLVTFWPLLLIFDWTGLEKFELPQGPVWGYLAINIVFGTLMFDYCWGKANIILGPLLANTSVIVVVPLSIIIEAIWQKVVFNYLYYIGTGLVVIGFFMIVAKDYRDSMAIENEEKNDLEEEGINSSELFSSESLVSKQKS